MNHTILAAVIIQSVISKANLLLGAIVGYVITTGILIWGLSVYSNPYHYIAFFGIELSKGVFLALCVIWYIFDTFELMAASSQTEADDNSDSKEVEAENSAGIIQEVHTAEDKFTVKPYENQVAKRPDISGNVIKCTGFIFAVLCVAISLFFVSKEVWNFSKSESPKARPSVETTSNNTKVGPSNPKPKLGDAEPTNEDRNQFLTVRAENKQEVANLPQKSSYPHPPSFHADELERDGLYVAYANGVVKNNKTGS